TEMLSAFHEWRMAQHRCLEEGLLVEGQMAEALRGAYQIWLAAQSQSNQDDAETGVIVTGKGAGEPHGQGHVHGWPLRMAAEVTGSWCGASSCPSTSTR